MNPLELRTKIYRELTADTGDEYGQISSVKLMPPEDTGASIGLTVTANDPMGKPRTYVVLLAEL